MLELSGCGTKFFWQRWVSGAFVLALFLGLVGGCDSSRKKEVEVEKDKKNTKLVIPNGSKKEKGTPEPEVKKPMQRVKWLIVGSDKEGKFEGPPPEKKEGEAKRHPPKAIVAVAFAAKNGSLLAFASEEGPVRQLDLTGKAKDSSIEGTSPLAFAPENNLLAYGAEQALDLRLALSPDGSKLALAHDDIKLVDTTTGKVLQNLELKGVHSAPVRAILFTDNKHLISAAGSELVFWDVDTGKHTSIETLKPYSVEEVTFTPRPSVLCLSQDGKTLLCASPGFPVVTMCDATNGKVTDHKHCHAAGFAALAFSADGKLLAAAHKDGSLRLWDATTGELHSRVADFGKTVTPKASSVAFSPDGTRLAVGCLDGTVQHWEVATLLKK